MSENWTWESGRAGAARLFRWTATPPGWHEVLRAARWTGAAGPETGAEAAAQSAAEASARLARPVAAVTELAPGAGGLWERLAATHLDGAAWGAVVALTLGPELEETIRTRLLAGDLAAGVWLEAAGNAVLAAGTALMRGALQTVLAADHPGEVAPDLLWVAPGCHGLPVELLPELATAAGGEAAGVVPLPGGGLAPGKSVAGLFIRPAASAAGEGLRRRLARSCAGCAAGWCPGRIVGSERRG